MIAIQMPEGLWVLDCQGEASADPHDPAEMRRERVRERIRKSDWFQGLQGAKPPVMGG